MNEICLDKKRTSCINCSLLKECKVKFGEWRGYSYGLENMKVIMLQDLEFFLREDIRLIVPMPKRKE